MSSSTDWEMPLSVQPKPEDYAYDLEGALTALVGLRAIIPADAFTAETLGTERSGMEFYGRGVKLVKDPRAREIFRKLATEEVGHLKKLEDRYQQLLKQDARLESRPTFLFFKGAANGLFSAGSEQLRRDGVI